MSNQIDMVFLLLIDEMRHNFPSKENLDLFSPFLCKECATRSLKASPSSYLKNMAVTLGNYDYENPERGEDFQQTHLNNILDYQKDLLKKYNSFFAVQKRDGAWWASVRTYIDERRRKLGHKPLKNLKDVTWREVFYLYQKGIHIFNIKSSFLRQKKNFTERMEQFVLLEEQTNLAQAQAQRIMDKITSIKKHQYIKDRTQKQLKNNYKFFSNHAAMHQRISEENIEQFEKIDLLKKNDAWLFMVTSDSNWDHQKCLLGRLSETPSDICDLFYAQDTIEEGLIKAKSYFLQNKILDVQCLLQGNDILENQEIAESLEGSV